MPSWLGTPAQRYRAILIGVLVIGAVAIVVAAWTALIPFFLGLILAYLLLPIVNFIDRRAPRFMRRRGWSRPIAIIIVYVVGLGLVAGVLSYFVPEVSEQAKVFIDAAPGYLERVQGLFAYDLPDLLEKIPPEIRDTVNVNIQKAAGTLLDAAQRGLLATVRTVSQTVSFVLGIVIIPFWLFYVLNSEAKARRAFYNLIPEQAREDVRCIGIIMDGLLSAYVRGQFMLCLLVGVMSTVALLLLGVDLALLLGTLAGVFELIPILGPYLGAIPPVLLALAKRPLLALWVALAFAAIQQIENTFLVPHISGSAVRFHPAVVMVIVVVASEVAGLWGMLLAVPVAAMARDVYRYLYLRTTERGATPEMALECLRASSL